MKFVYKERRTQSHKTLELSNEMKFNMICFKLVMPSWNNIAAEPHITLTYSHMQTHTCTRKPTFWWLFIEHDDEDCIEDAMKMIPWRKR